MASKISFVFAILFLALAVGFLAIFGRLQGYAWWRRKHLLH